MFIVNAKVYYYFMNLPFLYDCMLFSYVLTCSFVFLFPLVGRMSLVLFVQCGCSVLYFSEGVCCHLS
jgi:hypothetical protein